MKRIVCFFLCFVVLFSFSSCTKGESGDTDKKGETAVSSKPVSLPYSREEGLNPFNCRSLINYCLMPLLYGSLYKVDRSYYPVPDIATGYEITNMTLTVSLDTSRKFSSGQFITADDVASSFRSAKQSVLYGSSLRNISTCEVVSDDTVRFVTTSPNSYAAADLTFPVIPAKGGDEPAASGPYVYNSTTEGGTLTRNRYYPKSEYASATISLVNTADTSSLNMGLVIGTIDAWFDDMASGESKRISSGAAHVDLNNLVYLAFNTSRYFSNEKIRQAFAVYLDKEELLESGFEGYGQATNVPFNPQWYAAKDVAFEAPMTRDEAKNYIGSYLDKYTVTLLITSGNAFRQKCAERIGDMLKDAGVDTKIEVADRSLFEEALEAGRYDIYIGEFKMSNDMNTGPLFFGEYLQGRLFNMIAGAITPSEFMTDFMADPPFVPLCIRYGVVSYSKSIQGGVEPLPNNPFANITEWYK